MTDWIRLTLHHLRFVGLSFRRNPTAAFFGIFFPLMILTINGLIFGANAMEIGGKTASVATFYVAGMSVFAVVMTCFTNLATAILFDRDMGRLKRIRGTPTPVSAYIAARLTFAMAMGLLASMLCIADGALLFGVRVAPANLLPFAFSIMVGSASLAALSLAAVSAVPNAQAGPAILNAITFPVVFLSNVFYPIDRLPGWLITITHILPVRPLANSAIGAFFGAGPSLPDLAIVAGWGVLGALIAARSFQWKPRR